MIDYPDNVKVGDAVCNHVTGEPYDVEEVRYRRGHGWEAYTRRLDGYAGPTFYPHPDRMPSADLPTIGELLDAP